MDILKRAKALFCDIEAEYVQEVEPKEVVDTVKDFIDELDAVRRQAPRSYFEDFEEVRAKATRCIDVFTRVELMQGKRCNPISYSAILGLEGTLHKLNNLLDHLGTKPM